MDLQFYSNLIGLVNSLLWVYVIIIIVRVVAHWLGADPYNRIMQFLSRITDPLFDAIDRLLPASLNASGLRFSPLIAVLLLQVVSLFLDSVQRSLLH